MKKIESTTGVAFADFERATPFGSPALFKVCNYVEAVGECCWNAIDFHSGELTTNVSYEVGVGDWLGTVLFFLSHDHRCLVLVLPEADVGVQFVIGPDILDFQQNKDALLADYQYELDFSKLGEKNAVWTSFIYEWKCLPESLS